MFHFFGRILFCIVLLYDSRVCLASDRVPSGCKDANYCRRYSRALNLYEKERYQEALMAFTRAYQQHPNPRLLHNIGKVHQKLGHISDAIIHFKLALRESTKDRELFDAVNKALSELSQDDIVDNINKNKDNSEIMRTIKLNIATITPTIVTNESINEGLGKIRHDIMIQHMAKMSESKSTSSKKWRLLLGLMSAATVTAVVVPVALSHKNMQPSRLIHLSF